MSRPQEQIDQRVQDIDTAIAALQKQIQVLEAEKAQLLTGAAPAAALENTAKADSDAASYVGKFGELPPSLQNAKNADGCSALANVIVDQATALATTVNAIKNINAAVGVTVDSNGAEVEPPIDAGGKTSEQRDELRQKLEKTKAEASELRRDIIENAPSLSLDLYGCQLLARFLETSSKYADATGTPRDVEIKQIVAALAPHIKVVALINHGSRLLQRVADVAGSVATPAAAEALISACLPHLVDLASEANGSHLLLRLVGVKFQIADRNMLFKSVADHTLELAASRHGCGFLQRSIESCPTEDMKKSMINTVLENVTDLVHDPFGNYVLQFILDTKHEEFIEQIVRSLLHHIAAFARNKFGSNVIEKCVRLASEDVRQLLIDELTDPSVVEMLVRDEFANYVIQTAIVAASDAQFLQIQSAIRPFLNVLRTSPHGAKIESRMTRRVKDMQRSAAHARNRGDHALRAAQAQAGNAAFVNTRNQDDDRMGGGGGNGGGGRGGHQHHQHHHQHRHNNNNNNGGVPTINFGQMGGQHQHQHHRGPAPNNPYLSSALLNSQQPQHQHQHQQQFGGQQQQQQQAALMLASMATSPPQYAGHHVLGSNSAGSNNMPTIAFGNNAGQQQQQQQGGGGGGLQFMPAPGGYAPAPMPSLGALDGGNNNNNTNRGGANNNNSGGGGGGGFAPTLLWGPPGSQ